MVTGASVLSQALYWLPAHRLLPKGYNGFCSISQMGENKSLRLNRLYKMGLS